MPFIFKSMSLGGQSHLNASIALNLFDISGSMLQCSAVHDYNYKMFEPVMVPFFVSTTAKRISNKRGPDPRFALKLISYDCIDKPNINIPSLLVFNIDSGGSEFFIV